MPVETRARKFISRTDVAARARVYGGIRTPQAVVKLAGKRGLHTADPSWSSLIANPPYPMLALFFGRDDIPFQHTPWAHGSTAYARQRGRHRHLWVGDYTRDVRDVLDLQSEIARAVAQEVRIQMTPDEQARFASRLPVRPKAYDDYLQGRYLYWNKPTEDNLNKAIALFQRAINEDESYVPAYVGLADCYNALLFEFCLGPGGTKCL